MAQHNDNNWEPARRFPCDVHEQRITTMEEAARREHERAVTGAQ